MITYLLSKVKNKFNINLLLRNACYVLIRVINHDGNVEINQKRNKIVENLFPQFWEI